MRRWVRTSLLNALERTGLLWSPPRLTFGKDARQRFLILCYHRVSRAPQPDFLPISITCPESRFREHLAVLREHFRILPLEEASDLVVGGRSLPSRTVVLTFDDCWAENMQTVVRPLAEAGLPATFFISAGDIDREDLHPNHWFYYLASRVSLERLWQSLQSMLPACRPPFPRISSTALRRRLESYLGFPLASDEGRCFLESLAHSLKVSSSKGLGRTLYLSSAQVRTLPSYGIAIGNHTVNHRQLTTLDEAGQFEELKEGQRILSGLINKPVRTLAYPYGLPEHFDETSVTIATSLGHRCACSLVRGYNNAHTDPMKLRRINVTKLSGQELAFHLLWRRVA